VTTEAQPAKQTKLLIVEDDVMIRVVLADMLCELGYTVAAEAASIDEALEATRKTDFDLATTSAAYPDIRRATERLGQGRSVGALGCAVCPPSPSTR
jgi:CheY-like chemotaxis protein